MPWSADVHAHRTREARRQARLEARGGPAEPQGADASLLSLVAVAGKRCSPSRLSSCGLCTVLKPNFSFAGAVAACVAWQREGHQLRAHGVERWPLVGPWLDRHLPRRKATPALRAGAAAQQRAKVRACPGPLYLLLRSA